MGGVVKAGPLRKKITFFNLFPIYYLLVKKLGEEKGCQNPFSVFSILKKEKKIKVSMAIKLEGGKALMAWPLVKELFMRLP